jgi:GxxExxY protein
MFAVRDAAKGPEVQYAGQGAREVQGGGAGLRLQLDLIVEEKVIVELKAIEQLTWIHEAQLLTYLRLTGLRVGLVINFNVPVLKQGIRRVMNTR